MTGTEAVTAADAARNPAVEAVLRRMAAGGEAPLALVRDLVAAVGSSSEEDPAQVVRSWRAMLGLLEENLEYRRAAAETVFALLSGRGQRSLYTEAGLLPNTGFFSELRRRLVQKILPELVDESSLRDCVRVVFPGQGKLLRTVPVEDRAAFWKLLGTTTPVDPAAREWFREQLLDAALILSHRVAAMGLEPELARVLPRLAEGESPFLALNEMLTLFVRRYRNPAEATEGAGSEEEDGAHLLVLLDQCRDAVARAHHAAARRGTSMTLTFLLVRLRQHLARLELLLRVLSAYYSAEAQAELPERWGAFLRDAIEGDLQRDSVGKHVHEVLGLLALRVTENAGQTGEHYIALDRADWFRMWRAAAVGGFFIAFMALLKLKGAGLHLAALNQGVLNGAIYGFGFALIHLCHGTVATKQPAMTAAALASALGRVRWRTREVEGLAELVAATLRTQGAAIAGNLLVSFPLAVAVGAMLRFLMGDFIPADKAASLLADVDPLTGAPLLYAAVAGVWLFATGLVSGSVDNLVAYERVAERVARHPRLEKLVGRERAERIGGYLDSNAGGLVGSLFFGFMLGLTPALGIVLGLPLDIRHIAFSAANLGYALTRLDFGIFPGAFLRAATGVLLIGGVNLTVSFFLALWLALRSRGAGLGRLRGLLPALAKRFRADPSEFFFPGRHQE